MPEISVTRFEPSGDAALRLLAHHRMSTAFDDADELGPYQRTLIVDMDVLDDISAEWQDVLRNVEHDMIFGQGTAHIPGVLWVDKHHM